MPLSPGGSADTAARTGPETAHSRVVHVFDFTEPNNLDSEPMYWIPFPDPSLPVYPDVTFPRYTAGFRDSGVGHESAPSFYLDCMGRNIAYRYVGVETRVSPGDYLVTGWVSPDRLEHARAAISAYYLDWERMPLPGSQRFSGLIGSSDDESTWQEVKITLPPAPPTAYSVGLTCWIVQQDVWRAGHVPHRQIMLRDARGGAWFDDIAVLGLPRVHLKSNHPGNIIEQPARPVLLATVADERIDALSAKIIVFNERDEVVYQKEVAAHAYNDNAPPERVAMPALPPGLYTADLRVSSFGSVILDRMLHFAVLRPSGLAKRESARRMGVILDGAPSEDTAVDVEMTKALGVGAVKLLLWTGDADRPGFEDRRDVLQETLNRLIESRVTVLGVLDGPPKALSGAASAYAPTLLDVLSEDARAWRPALESVVAPYASIFESWQLGGDGDERIVGDNRLAKVVDAVNAVMSTMMTSPELTTVARASDWPNEKLPVDNLSVELPSDVRPEFVADHLAPYQTLGYRNLWVTLPLPNLGVDEPWEALSDWGLRVVEALHSGVDGVFVREPWTTEPADTGTLTEPTLPYLVYRTLANTLAGTAPLTRFKQGDHTQVVAFGNGTRSVLIVWDESAPDGGREIVMQLGDFQEAVDLLGRSVPVMPTADGRHTFKVSRMPTLIAGVEQWLVSMRARMRLTPHRIDFSYAEHQHLLEIANPSLAPLSGEVTLTVPETWDVKPDTIQFSLEPGQTGKFPVKIHLGPSEGAGEKIVPAHVKLLSAPGYEFDAPLKFELGLSDIDVWAYAVQMGDHLVVRQGVTNRSGERLSFRGFAVYPGRSRQYRVINEILPDQTLTMEYRFGGVHNASGRKVHLGLREVNGPRMHNLQVTVP